MSDSIDNQQEDKKEEGFVSRKAYEGVSNDMHQFKSKAKEAEARANELEARLKAIEEEKMREQNQWEDLYKKRSEELENLQRENRDKELRYVKTAKKTALRMELGEVRDEYLMHANIDAIQLNEDGSINTESLHAVANDFREKHSALLPKNASSTSTNAQPNSDFEAQEITVDEFNAMVKGKDVHERMEIFNKYKGKIKEN